MQRCNRKICILTCWTVYMTIPYITNVRTKNNGLRVETWEMPNSMFEPVRLNSISGILTPSYLLAQKVKPRWLPMEWNFVLQFQSLSWSCMSVPLLYTTLIFRFFLIWLLKPSQPWTKCSDEILPDQFYIFECLKGFIIAVWLNNCPKLFTDGKVTVKKGRAFIYFLK